MEVPAEDGTYTFNETVSNGEVSWEVAGGGGGSQRLMITASKPDDFTTVLDKTFQEIYNHIRSGEVAYVIYDRTVHNEDTGETITCHYVYSVTAITSEDVNSDEEDYTTCCVEITWHASTAVSMPEYFWCDSPTDYSQFNND